MDDRVASITTANSPATTATRSGETTDLARWPGLQEFLDDLVARQCRLAGGLAGLLWLQPSREEPEGSTARWEADPGLGLLEARSSRRLAEIGARAARENRPVSEALASDTGLLSATPEYRVLAAPLRFSGRPQGASVCVLPGRVDEHELAEATTSLDLSTMLLEAWIWRQQYLRETEAKILLRETLDLLDKANQGASTREMASLFAHELERRFGCRRVSIGLVHGHAIRVWAIGGSEDLDRKSELAEAVEAVMEECADQDIEIRHPQPEDLTPAERRVTRAHAAPSERFGPTAIASFPLRVEGGLIGVAVLERDVDDPFNDATLRLLRLVAEYLGPSLWTRRMADRGILAVTRDRTTEGARWLVGPEKTGAKLVGLLVALLLLAAFVLPVPDRVKGESSIRSEVRREISAPFEGRIESIAVRPGDVVTAGMPLVRMDVRETMLQLRERRNELARARMEADEARGTGKVAEARMLDARVRAAEADVELLEARIDRAVIRAPFDGVVTQGNLEDRVGEMVNPGRPLLRLARTDTLEAIVLVPERGIPRVEPGQEGRLVLTARPSEPIDFIVRRITPAAEVVEQRNAYRVSVELESRPEWLRPGMEGQARIFGGRSNLATIYGRPLVDALRMRVWW